MIRQTLRGLAVAAFLGLDLCAASAAPVFFGGPRADTLHLDSARVKRVSLPEVPVHGGRWSTQSQVFTVIPSAAAGWTTEPLLRAGIDVRQTNPGGSAWVLLDGLPTTHTWIDWEGIALHAADLGVMDLRLLPSAGLVMSRSADGLRLENQREAHVGAEASSLGNTAASAWIPGPHADFGLSLSQGRNRYRYLDYLGDPNWRIGAEVARAEFRTAWRNHQGPVRNEGAAYVVALQQGLPEATTVPRRPGAQQSDLRLSAVQKQQFTSGRWHWQSTQYLSLTRQRFAYALYGGIYDTNSANTLGVRVRSDYRLRTARVATSLDVDRLSAEGPNKTSSSVLRVHASLRGSGMLGSVLRLQWGLSQLRQGDHRGRLLPLVEVGSLATKPTQWTLKLHAHQRFPTLNDQFWRPGGNPELRAEWGWEARASLRRTSLNAELYAGKLHDAIVWMPVGTLWTPRNAGLLRRLGGHVQQTWTQGNWSAMARVSAVYSANEHGFLLPYAAPWTASVSVGRRWAKWEFRADPRLRGATPTAWSSEPTTWLPVQGQLDLSATRTTARTRFSLSMGNATGAPLMLQYGFPLPGRTLNLAWSTRLTPTNPQKPKK